MVGTNQSSSSINFTLFFLFFLYLNLSCLHANELEILLSFKSSLNDPPQFLSSWSSSSSSSNSNICLWNGVVCDAWSRVISLDLSGNNISGQILSSDIFRLPFVQTIDLSNNKLSGPIPHDIFSTSSPSLRHLNLSNNNFMGSVPRGYIPDLETLDLSNNMLSGEILEDFGSFSNLRFLDLGGNVLTGRIPVSIGNLTRLEFLTLASNQLTGGIPMELGHMKSLKWIYLGYNNLSGEIPKQIGDLQSLNHLDIVYNNLTGEIPSSFGNLHELQYLFLYQNKLSGRIPTSIFGLTKLVSLDLSDNVLSGEIPESVKQLQSLEILHLFSNNFTGKIPEGITSLPRLQVLQLWSNKFSGEIPEDLGKQNNLTVLDLSTNNLTGKVPDGLCDSGHLQKLILFSNSLNGEIPPSFGACKSLERVRLQNNRFTGELPHGFTQLQFVYFLDLSNNELEGNIGARAWDMPKLQMLNLGHNHFTGDLPDLSTSRMLQKLELSGNIFTGKIPKEFGRFSELMDLDLSENKIKGEIPSELCSCKKLVNLDLSNNVLAGQIPSSFSEFPVLGDLDLSCNQLSGEIPKDLGKIESLVQVNVSHNLLRGSLPSTGAFLAINVTAITGNDLCLRIRGSDNTSGLPPCKSNARNNAITSWWFSVSLTLAALLFVLASGYLITLVLKKTRCTFDVKRVEEGGTTWDIQLFDSRFAKSFNINMVLSSTKDQNVISIEKKGVLYKGRSDTNDMEFVVKDVKNRDFSPHISEIGKICHHRNILKLLGTCRSEKVAYLVYEHVEGRRLSDILQGLSWERRRKIIIGIAKALRFLHLRCSPAIFSGELSPESIFVDGKNEPRLSLGLPGLLCMEAAYMAPETRESKEMTSKSDIYGFGLLLLQLLTGKSPADVESGINGGLVNWARQCYSDYHINTWIDSSIDTSDYHSQIIKIMNLALNCTVDNPQDRPSAENLVETLDYIFRISSCTSNGFKKFSSV